MKNLLFFILVVWITSLQLYAQGDGTGFNCEDTRTLACGVLYSFGTFQEPKNVDAYCDRSTGLTGGKVVYRFSPEITHDFTFRLSGISSGDDLDTFLTNDCGRHSCSYQLKVMRQEEPCTCCREGKVSSFEDQLAGLVSTFFQAPWQVAYGTPSYDNEGCDSQISIALDGPTRTTTHDAVRFSLQGVAGVDTILRKDQTYCIRYCYRSDATSAPSSIIMRAGDGSISGGNCGAGCVVIDQSPAILSSDGWQQYAFTWTAPADYTEAVWHHTTVQPTDGLVTMHIDNICITPYEKPCLADFMATADGCGNLLLTNLSCGDSLTYQWDINGTIYTTQDVHISGPGPYVIVLTIRGIDGCLDTITKTIVVHPPTPLTVACPTDTLISAKHSANCQITYTLPSFYNNSYKASCTYNGLPITADTSLILGVGTYAFSCVMTDSCEQSAVCNWTVTVECLPQDLCCKDEEAFCDLVDLGMGIAQEGNYGVTVTLSQIDSCHITYNSEPDWGDGSINSLAVRPANGTWRHQYAQSGIHSIRFINAEQNAIGQDCWVKNLCDTVTNTNGIYTLVDTLTNVIDLAGATAIGSISATACVAEPVQMGNNSCGDAAWLWGFGDGTTSSVSSRTKTYDTLSTYNISLTATDQYGCQSGRYTHTIMIAPAPTINITTLSSGLTGCVGDTIILQGSSGYPTYQWIDVMVGTDISSETSDTHHPSMICAVDKKNKKIGRNETRI